MQRVPTRTQSHSQDFFQGIPLKTASLARRVCLARILALVTVLVSFASPAQAIVLCVSDAAGLKAALSMVESIANPDYQIKLVRSANVYAMGFDSRGFLNPVHILGGYAAGCAENQRVVNPTNTVLDFSGSEGLNWYESHGSPAVIEIDGVTLQNGTAVYLTTGVYHMFAADTSGDIRLTRSIIHNLLAAGSVILDTTSGTVTMNNVRIDHILSDSPCPMQLALSGDSSATLVQVTADLAGGNDLCLHRIDFEEGGTSIFTIANSIVWGSDGGIPGIRCINPSGDQFEVRLDHDLFHTYIGDGTAGVANQINADPLWVAPTAATPDYHLMTSGSVSPAINSGLAQSDEPYTDIDGNPRVVGSAPDRGAYESPLTDLTEFTVTNTGTGCGFNSHTLCDAITQANSSPAAKLIKFAIPDPAQPGQFLCPAVIALPGVLPDIVKQIFIDGSTQPGSKANADALAFDANICVAIVPDGNTPYAFRVPANPVGAFASLTLRGLGLGGFPTAVTLLGGVNHEVIGNQFGGLMDNDAFQLYGSSYAALNIDVNSLPTGQILVGGSNIANRNLFLNASSFGVPPAASAILINSHVTSDQANCQIVGNVIGIAADGMSASKNTDYGIFGFGTGCTIRNNRIAGIKNDAILLPSFFGLGGSGYLVQNNVIGLLPYGFDLSTSNVGAGIRLAGSNNVIGAPADFTGTASNVGAAYFGNLIENMDGGGIVVVGNNIAGNTIRGNTMFSNGVGGDGMSIDLGGDGATANDLGDADVGPNNLLNFPVVTGNHWTIAPLPGSTNLGATVTGVMRGQTGPDFYQIDVYYAHGCNTDGRGTAEKWIGSVDNVYIGNTTTGGNFSVAVTIPDFAVADGTLSVTATRQSNGDGSTSEHSRCVGVDTIFHDRLELD